MTPQIDRFLKLATRSLQDQAELQDEAETELMSRLGEGGVPLDLIDVAELSARLEEKAPVDTVRRRLLIAAAFLVALVMGIRGVGVDLLDVASIAYSESLSWQQIDDPNLHFNIGGTVGFADVEAQVTKMLGSWMTAGAVDLPLSGKRGDQETAVLRQRHPEDLGILQEHLARRSHEAAEFMTGEERAMVERLDPDNALWPLMEMRWLERTIEFRSNAGLGKMTGEEAEQCHRLLSRAAASPRLVNHAIGLLARQKAALPTANGVADVVRAETMAGFVTEASSPKIFWGYRSEEWLSVRLTDLSPDRDQILRLRDELLAVEKLRCAGPESAVQDLSRNHVFMDNAYQHYARHLGPDVALTAYPQPHQYLPWPEREQAGVWMRGTRLLPTDLTAEEMKPLRMAEQCLFDRFLVWACTGLSGVVAFVTLLESIRRKRVVKALARGLMPLLTRRDHVWIGGLGIVLPWLWYFFVTVILPCGGAWAESDEEMVIRIMQGGLVVVMSIILIIHASEWRWAKRAAVLGLDSGLRIFGWLAAALTALAILAAGLYPHLENAGFSVDETYLLGCAGAGATGGLWLLWVAIRNLFTGNRASLRPNLISRTALPWMLAGLATLLISAGILQAMEGRWVKREPLLRLETSRIFVNALAERGLDHRCAQIREWIREQPQP
jgi:hypothetical protein